MSLKHVGVMLTRLGAVILVFSLRVGPSTRTHNFYYDHHQSRRYYGMVGENVHHAGFGLEDEVSVDTGCCSEIANDP